MTSLRAIDVDEASSSATESDVVSPASVAELLRRSMDHLTPAERRVARTLLAGYPAVGLTSAAELATEASVSPASVVRLVQKLGFHGYPEFQGRILDELSGRLAGPGDRIDRGKALSEEGGILATLSQALADNIVSLNSSIPESEFNAAVELLSDPSRRLLLTGGQISQNWAALFATYLLRMRGEVALLSRDPTQRTAALLEISRKTVLVAFDFRRYELGAVEITQLAAKRGAKIILVTDLLLSPASANAHIVLPIEVEVPAPFDTSVTGVALVECLALATLRRLGDAGVSRMRSWDTLAAPGLVR